ncbi:MAG: flagellar hook-associated protein FlgL [Clostridium argentinense]|uniref:flagellar hook-associated protein FlgL n=1 Tax=Clostridium butanoliproducens TaxID=2991837 RepID=UPI001D7E1AC9|nr:flagellar hook-associated protein FlgL [Clostridium butanoliproducens]MBS5825185.1 flagellar hook-associated protein FlgL [Clostridium argentinense]MDU1349513.1 flagellar hook-associated protein FlgL [Clostridium argentinense]
MRVTDKMLSDSFLNDMYINLNNMKKIQEQRTSGKAFKRPSDNPFAVSRSMQMYEQISANKQYNTNIKDTINWLNTTDSTLDQAGKALARIKELMVSAGNITYGSEEHRAVKDEINEKIGELSQILNSSFDGKYIFAGTRGDKKPTEIGTDGNGNNEIKLTIGDFSKEINEIEEKIGDDANGIKDFVEIKKDADGNIELILKEDITDDEVGKIKEVLKEQIGKGIVNIAEVESDDNKKKYELKLKDVEFGQVNQKLKIEISQGVVVDYNVNITEIFNFNYKAEDGTTEKVTLGELLKGIVDHLDDKSQLSEVVNSDLAKMESAINNILTVRSKVGAMQNRMDSAKRLNEDQNMNLTDILSHNEDVDVVEKSIEYATMVTVYMSALQTSAQILQPSLIDYLR